MSQFPQLVLLTMANVLFFYLLLVASSTSKAGWKKVVALVIVVTIYSLLQFYTLHAVGNREGFFFEVSPQRKKCLQEQVSLSGDGRSSECCGKGTTGGYPARMISQDFVGDSDTWNWPRVDAFQQDPSITPPSEAC